VNQLVNKYRAGNGCYIFILHELLTFLYLCDIFIFFPHPSMNKLITLHIYHSDVIISNMKLRAALVCTNGARPAKHTHAINRKSSSTGFVLYMIKIVCPVADRFAWWQAAQRSQLIKLAVSRGPRVVVQYIL
jgi:hypothetical protein